MLMVVCLLWEVSLVANNVANKFRMYRQLNMLQIFALQYRLDFR